MKRQIGRQEKERLNNRVVLLSSCAFLYALLLLFIERMAASSMTVNGALAFIQILRWGSLAGAMLCAAWSAYKEKKSFFIYSGMSMFMFLSTTVLLYCGRHGKAFLINYFSLAIVFVMTQIYYAVMLKTGFESKISKIVYGILCLVLFLAIAALCIWQKMA